MVWEAAILEAISRKAWVIARSRVRNIKWGPLLRCYVDTWEGVERVPQIENLYMLGDYMALIVHLSILSAAVSYELEMC